MLLTAIAFRRIEPGWYLPFLTTGEGSLKDKNVAKTWRIMRITAILLTIFCIQVSAKIQSQTITYSGEKVILEKLFNVIKKQTGFLVVYNKEQIQNANPVNIKAKKKPLREFLDDILINQNFEYTIEKNTISIKKKKTISDDKPATHNPPPPVTGIVKGPDGKPLEGVNIMIKGTKKGTLTDRDGRFSIDADEGTVLEISSIGFGKKEINVSGRELVVALEIALSVLDEVQYIAYGQTSRRFNVGNVSTVKAEDIEKQPVNNPILALQGRVPGLTITQSTGVAGSSVNIRIQGRNNLNPLFTGSDPLIVIDGVPYPSQNIGTFESGLSASNILGAKGSTLFLINPSDIESIDVLKDADATSIYGSRAANGAILITTKKGKAGETKAEIGFQHGWGEVAHHFDMLNSQQYLEMRHEAFKNDGLTPTATDYDINGTWDTTRYTNWQKELIGGTAQFIRATATISGGNSNMNYLIGGTFSRETTVYPGDFSDKRGSVHFNINGVSNNKRFQIQLTGSYLMDNNTPPGVDLTQAINLAPVAPSLYNADGTLNWAPDANGNSSWVNPLSYNYNIFEIKSNNLLANSVLTYKILPGLELKGSFGGNQIQSNQFLGTLDETVKPEARATRFRFANFTNNTIKSWIVEPQSSYKISIGSKSKLDFLIGATFQHNSSNGFSNIVIGHSSDALLRNPSAGTFSLTRAENAVYRYNALFGRLNYILKDRYLFNFSARRDGSSRFGSNNRFHNFGAIGAGWIFSEETFIKRHLSFISFGKLKGSYGTTGNDQIGDYQFLSLFGTTYNSMPYQSTRGLQSFGISNPNLQWEETEKLQGGIDIGLFNERIFFSASYFRNRTDNTLTAVNLPIITGAFGFTNNFPALIQNAGWELSLITNAIKKKNITWSINFNLTIPHNKLVSFPGIENSSSAEFLVVGQPLNITKEFSFYGIDPSSGDILFNGKNGNITNAPDYFTDRIAIMNFSEKLYGGLINAITYKNFQLDFLIQFTKQKGWNWDQINTPGVFDAFSSRVANQPVAVLNRWQAKGDVTSFPRYSTSFFTNAILGDIGFKDASYIRLKNISASYHFSKSICSKLHLKDWQLFINGQNLFTITSYKGLDPETQSISYLPPLRVVTIGVQVTL